MSIVQVSLHERCTTRIHHEEHDAEGEPVGDLGLVGTASEELGRHVLHRTHKSVAETKSILTLNRASESKVCDFEVEVRIKEDVLKFKVSVCNALSMHVRDAFDKLLGVVSDDGHRQSTLADEVGE